MPTQLYVATTWPAQTATCTIPQWSMGFTYHLGLTQWQGQGAPDLSACVNGSQSVATSPTALASYRKRLEIQILWPHSSTTGSENLEEAPNNV